MKNIVPTALPLLRLSLMQPCLAGSSSNEFLTILQLQFSRRLSPGGSL